MVTKEVTNYRGQELTLERGLEVLLDYLEGRRAYGYDASKSECLYRTPNDAACVIGSFISDEVIKGDDIKLVGSIYFLIQHCDETVLKTSLGVDTLRTLQKIHDDLAMGFYTHALRGLFLLRDNFLAEGVTFTPREDSLYLQIESKIETLANTNTNKV